MNTWEEKRPEGGSSSHHKKGFGVVDEDDEQEGVTELVRAPLRKEMTIMFRRCAVNVIRGTFLLVAVPSIVNV